MEKDQSGADVGRDLGRDHGRDLGDEPPVALRDKAPDYLAPIDASSPVSGHLPPTGSPVPISESPEHEWERARILLFPAFRPVGTKGLAMDSIDRETLTSHGALHHTQPLLDQGPAGLPVVYTMGAGGFDVVVNGDHLLSWGVEASAIRDAAMANLAGWSATAPWTIEESGDRRLVSSETGDGWDAARILLPETVAHLVAELGSLGRILVGIPERYLLAAGALPPDDDEFATLFADFVVEQSGGADEPIDRRLFELVDGRLVEFGGPAAGL